MSGRLEYTVISVMGSCVEDHEAGVTRLKGMVNEHLEDGWVPQGGVSMGVSRNDFVFAQAMTRVKGVSE